MRMITVKVGDVTKEYEAGVTYERIAEDFCEQYDSKILLANANGKLVELHKMAKDDCSLDFLTIRDKAGLKTYRRSCTLLLARAVSDVLGKNCKDHLKVEYSVSKGLYCTIKGDTKITDSFITSVQAKMDDLVEQNLPIWKTSYSLNEAIKLFNEKEMTDKSKVLRFRRASKVNIYSLGDYQDYYYGYMVPSTGYLTCYELYKYDDGLVLQMPVSEKPDVLPPFEPQNKIFNVMKETDRWGKMIGIETVGDLNECICRGELMDVALVQEALMEAKIAEIANAIKSREGCKFVMIAGPSSSGKTTFSHRLSIQLRALGITPHPIALDDYFKNREDTPKDENGDYNFECLEAMDVEGFNKDMTALLRGDRVELPDFNFKTGRREYKGKYLQLGAEDVLVLEGIHGLNEKMSYSLPAESKFKIYISALTSLNVDEHNRIPTTDVRLIRRMVRDYRTRGTSAKGTLDMWPSVRRGEEENIFPFQESADAIFNSALIYELSVLKQFAEPLLFGIEQSDPQYQEAKRLLKFLDYFLGVTSEQLPLNSLLREFIGGSVIRV